MKHSATKYLFLLFFYVLFLKLFQAFTSHGSALDGYTNYWNFDKNLVDKTYSSLNLYNSHNMSWVNNRRGENNSALYLNNGFIQINTSSVSWTGDFTIAAWVHVKTRMSCGKLLDCGIKGQNELVINLHSCNGDGQSLQVYSNRSVSGLVYNRNILGAKWQHVAFTFNHGKIVIYTDGVPVASGTTHIKPNVNTNYGTCFIGKSQWNNNPNIDAYIDDLWMFNRGLSADEVKMVMNSSIAVLTTTSSKSRNQTHTTFSSSSSTRLSSAKTGYPQKGTTTNSGSTTSMRSTATEALTSLSSSTKSSTTTASTMISQSSNRNSTTDQSSSSTKPTTTRIKTTTKQSNSNSRSTCTASMQSTATNQLTSLSSSTKNSTLVQQSTTSTARMSSSKSRPSIDNSNHPKTTTSTRKLSTIQNKPIISSAPLQPTIITRKPTSSLAIEEHQSTTNALDQVSATFSITTPAIGSRTTVPLTTSITTTTLNPNDKLMVFLATMRLINHWNFDNNTRDLKSGLPLSIERASFTEDRFNKEISAIAFDFGRMKVPGFYFRGGFSILAWVYISNVDAAEQRLLQCEDTKKENILTFTLQTGNNKYSYFSFNEHNKIQASDKLRSRQWIQVAATLSSNNIAEIWFNGKSVSRTTFSNFPQNLTWAECYIGYTSDNSANLNLRLDDLMLFANGLTEGDINLIKDNTVVRPPGPTDSWQFNGNLIDEVTNLALDDNNRVIHFSADRKGREGFAMYFSNGKYQIANCPDLSSYTVMFWIKRLSDADQDILHLTNGLNYLTILSTKGYYYVNDHLMYKFVLVLSQWTHIAATQNGNEQNLYTNGNLNTLDINAGTMASTTGNTCDFGSNGKPLLSKLDDLMFFDKVLSASEIQVFMNS